MDKIPIAIVGLNFGKHIINQIVEGEAEELFSLAGVCDLDVEKVRSFSEQYLVPGFTNLDELLQQEDIPVIGLFTGPVGRAGLLRKIIHAGKDVITTKPFELDCQAALEVLREAKKMGRVIHLNSPAPCLSPDLQKVKNWEKEFALGRPVGCNLSVWVRYNQQADGSWYDDPIKCPVAPIFRLGIYLINDLVTLMGEAEKVSVMSSRIFTGRPTPDNAQLSILFKNGAIANIYASFCVEDGDHYRNSMVLNYDKGTIYRNVGPERTVPAGANGAEMSLVTGSGDTSREIAASELVSSCSGQYQWENMASAVRGEKIEEITTPESIVAGLRIIEAMSKADRSGGTAEVLPV